MVKLRISSLAERLRSSFFFVPMLAVLGAVAAGQLGLTVDRHVDTTLGDLPLELVSTVDSARTLLGVIAGATISFAGIAFSVSLLIIQLASSQYSPRVVHTLFRDPFNRRVMALVVGTFTYCVVVLRSVRSALDPDGQPVVPNISIAVAMVLGIATILAIVAFINHSAHSMDVSEILDRIRRETIEQIHDEWNPVASDRNSDNIAPPPRADSTTVIRADRSGWVQEIDTEAMLACLPEGCTAHVETHAGRYVIEHSVLVVVSPAIDVTGFERAVLAAFMIGKTRTMQQDVTYGLRQLVDVTVKALSPGINDPTTAQDAIFHTSAVLFELLRNDPPPPVMIDGSRCLVMAQQPSWSELIQIAYDEPRRAAATDPTVCMYLLATLHSLDECLRSVHLDSRTTELRRQADLVTRGCGNPDVLDDDIDLVCALYEKKFGDSRG